MATDRYSVTQEDFEGHVVYALWDGQAGQVARVLPSVDNNCVSYRVRLDQREVELLHAAPDPETPQGRPSGYGIPLFFPWPNRIENGRFAFDGTEVSDLQRGRMEPLSFCGSPSRGTDRRRSGRRVQRMGVLRARLTSRSLLRTLHLHDGRLQPGLAWRRWRNDCPPARRDAIRRDAVRADPRLKKVSRQRPTES